MLEKIDKDIKVRLTKEEEGQTISNKSIDTDKCDDVGERCHGKKEKGNL